ncbi:MAG: ATP-binding cassette domain-containing protein, partial [Brevefilum sp.]
MKQTLIKMQNIVKVFPPEVVALDDVTVAFNEGEIHAIVGENGAGKSTLMKILYGMQPADQGQLFLKSQPVAFQNSSDAIKSGIGMVHQEILLIDQYTVWENVILGLEPTNFLGFIDQKEARDRVQENISAYDFNLNPEDRISEISIGARQKVEILKLLYRNVNVLILDEPTAVLTPQEIPRLFDQLMQLRESGHTILFISHHLDEVMELSDRITVLRHGRKIATVPTAQTSKVELAEMMVGREVIFTSLRQPKTPGKIVFKVQNLNYQDLEGKQRLSN